MKWYKTSEILPKKNRPLLLLIYGDIRYTNCYQIGQFNVVMGVYMKNEIPNLHPIDKIRAWSYVPSVSEIEASLLNLQ